MEEQQPGQVITPGAQPPASSATELPEVDVAATPKPEETQVEITLSHDELPPVAQATPVAEETVASPEPAPVEAAAPLEPPQHDQVADVDPRAGMPEPASPELSTAMPAAPQEEVMTSQQTMPGEPDFAWTAQEYEHDERGALWYLLYLAGSVLIGAAVYLITRDVISAVVVCMAAAGLIYVVARKPREQTFVLDSGQLAIGKSVYVLHNFKAFAVDEHGNNIVLLPMKRFFPPITLYVGDQYRDTVAQYLSQYLPSEQHAPDAVDRLLRKIHL